MNFALIEHSSLAIRLHLLTVVPAFALGTWLIFFSAKGSKFHRALGALYLGLMTITAAISFFIRNQGSFSPLHLFIPLTAYGVISSVLALRRRDIKGHKRAMLRLYFGGLVIAGSLTLLPGRLLHHVFFG